MDKDRLGALIDAIYAIAMTILVLELPVPESGVDLSQSIQSILVSVIDYAITFFLLFAFWYNQRRINDLVVQHSRLTLWLNGLALMFVCLLPFAANIVYKYGGEAFTVFQLSHAAFADLAFIGVTLSVDFLLHLCLWIIHHSQYHDQEDGNKVIHIFRARRAATVILITGMFIVIILPGESRKALLIIPLVLIFEEEALMFWERITSIKNLRR